ncbi:MAG: DEAD/DEAH box helicase [Bacteroidales bacterium]|nr:DEAD/DEAH box helicase [Bacteroidales bacterium]
MKSFQELGICPEILKAIEEMGYEAPMPVQEEVIPYLLEEESDIVALAQTGTGKTAAFGLPVIQKVNLSHNKIQALILSPTRELCLQIAGDLADYSKYMPDLRVLPVYGGSSIDSQIKALRRGVHIVVATPGRLIDLMNRGVVNLEMVRNLILDEADEMLNMGFTESINAILANVPKERNTLLFSATMPAEISRIAKTYMRNAKEITIGTRNEGTKNVKHVSYVVHAKDKYLALKRIADYNPNIYGIIFCRTRKETQEIADMLIQDGYSADSLHGELSQAQRDYVMQKFRVKNVQLLVATDVAARGLDVNDLTHVINYGLPDDIETYTHRSGRTGRANKSGISIALIHVREKHKLRDIERIIQKKFESGHLPSGYQICEKQLLNLMDKIEKVEVTEEEIGAYMPAAIKKLEWLSKEDLLKRVVSMEFNRLIAYYRNAGEIDIPDERSAGRDRMERSGKYDRPERGGDRDRGRGERPERGGERGERFDRGDRTRERGADRSGDNRAEAGFTRLFINIGKTDGLYPNQVIELINNNVGGRVQIGKIDLMKAFSFFEVESHEAKNVVKGLNKADWYGRKINVEVAGERSEEKPAGDRKSFSRGSSAEFKSNSFSKKRR